MECLGTWGTQVESASLAQIPIYVLTKGVSEGKWIMYKNQSLSFHMRIFLFNGILNHLEVCHTNGNHYDCVISVNDQCSTVPPVLQECHKHVSEVL